jgi:hypothetical protein
MEHYPHSSSDDEPRGPEEERLWPGEIDLTGAVSQPDALADVIGDAISEAEDGVIPEWGARTLARALADELDDPISGALHHFAITGLIRRDALLSELDSLHHAVTDDEIRGWTLLLGWYVRNPPDTAP